jgi:hypothetical protein
MPQQLNHVVTCWAGPSLRDGLELEDFSAALV